MELGISKLLKKYAKLIGRPTSDVRKVWEDKKCKLLENGVDPKNSDFLLLLSEEVKRELNIQEDYVCLDKFKKFL